MSPESTETDQINYGFMTSSSRLPSFEKDKAMESYRAGVVGNIAVLAGPLDWKQDAACIKQHPNNFYTATGDRKVDRDRLENAAKAVCAQCFVKSECLDYAMTNNEGFGVWGGLTTEERRDLTKWRKQSTPGTTV